MISAYENLARASLGRTPTHEGGRFRRSHLVPVPEVDTLADLNVKIEQIEAAEDARHIDNRPTSVGFDFEYEAPLLAPLPFEDFDIGLTLTPKVDKTSRITVRLNKYSVPARFIGENIRISLRADEIWVFDRHEIVVRHERLAGRYGFRDLLDHYLEILRQKPGAMENSTGLAAARESGMFTPVHDAFWAAARESRGRAEGTRALIDVLLLHRRMPHEAVVAGMNAVLEAGSISPDPRTWSRSRPAKPSQPPAGHHRSSSPRPRMPRSPTDTPARTPTPPRSSHCPRGVPPSRRAPGRNPRWPPTASCSLSNRKAQHDAEHHPRFRNSGAVGLHRPARSARRRPVGRDRRGLPEPGPGHPIRDRWEEFAAQALREHASYADFLADLLESEFQDRDERRKFRRVKEAGFPRNKRIEDFDFSKNPNISQEVINTLTQPGWVQAGHPLCLIGDSGTGKSHLLIGLGTAIAEAGARVRYTTAANLVNELAEAAGDKQLGRTIKKYGRVDLLCLDELGYVKLDRHGAELLF